MSEAASPRLWGALSGVIGLLVFAVFVAAGSPQRGVVGAFSTFALMMAVRIRWDRRTSPNFWMMVGLMAAAHAIVLILAGAPYQRVPGMVFLPFVFLDIFVMVWLLGRLKRVS